VQCHGNVEVLNIGSTSNDTSGPKISVHAYVLRNYDENEDTMSCHKLSVEEDGEVGRRGEGST
jgi:hypothetical protein